MLKLDHTHNRRISLLGSRRRDSGASIASAASAFSNFSKYSHLSHNGKICITLEVESMRYLKSSDEYDIKLSEASVISLDTMKRNIRCKIKANKIRQIQEELDEDDFSSMIESIDYGLDHKSNPNDNDACATNDKAIQGEWSEIAPKRRNKKEHRAYGSCCIGDCDYIERIAFMMKYYSIFMKFKGLRNIENDSNTMYRSMTHFIKKLKGYNRVRLLSDYYHVKKYHMNNDCDKELLDYMKKKAPLCDDIEVCCCLKRNEGPKQIYRRLSVEERRELYYISDDIKDASEEEMSEIVLIGYLDIIHSLFIHSGIISNGNKFVTEVEADRNGNNLRFMASLSPLPDIALHKSKPPSEEEGADDDDNDTVSDISTIAGAIMHRSVPVLQSSFGESFDYWKPSHPLYCRARHVDLKMELLSNSIHSMSSDDYALLMIRARDYIGCDIGSNLLCKREFRWMNKSIKYGDKASVDHIVSLLLCTNYSDIITDFRKIGCRKMDNNECIADVSKRHSEIAHFCRYLKECIWCFGDVLSEKQRVYHAINTKLAFPKCSVSFDAPSSVTTKYFVAQKMAHHNTNIVLKLGKIVRNEQNMAYFDVSCFSYYPAEKERIIFGGNLGFADIVYSGSSHADSVISLTLYREIIGGKWYNDKSNIFFKKKYQRKIVKMMSNMINFDEEHLVHNKYMQQLFESITKYKKTVWMNKTQCETLINELNTLLFDKYCTYLIQNGIQIKYAHSIEMKLSVAHINESSFKKSLYSNKYTFAMNNTGDKCSLHFRCYKKYDAHKQEDMFRGFVATNNKLKTKHNKIQLKYGLQFKQLPYNKWDSCTITNQQLYKGSSLFKMKDIQNLDTLTLNLSFQIHAIYDENGALLQI